MCGDGAFGTDLSRGDAEDFVAEYVGLCEGEGSVLVVGWRQRGGG